MLSLRLLAHSRPMEVRQGSRASLSSRCVALCMAGVPETRRSQGGNQVKGAGLSAQDGAKLKIGLMRDPVAQAFVGSNPTPRTILLLNSGRATMRCTHFSSKARVLRRNLVTIATTNARAISNDLRVSSRCYLKLKRRDKWISRVECANQSRKSFRWRFSHSCIARKVIISSDDHTEPVQCATMFSVRRLLVIG